MPHAALLVVQDQHHHYLHLLQVVSMPHAALLVVQELMEMIKDVDSVVSMPHAALLVVQAHRSQPLSLLRKNALLESLRIFDLSNGKT